MNRSTFYLSLFVGWLVLAACGSVGEEAGNTAVSQPTFTNVAADVGLDFQHGAFRWGLSGDPVAMMGGGLCWLDYDNDGWMDLYAVNSYALDEAGRWETEEGGLPQNALFHNQKGQFQNVGGQSGTNLALRGNGCVAADLDLDGWTDIYVTTSRVNMLLWNNGNGTFTEGGAAAGVDAYGWQTAVSVGDVNGDGWPDMFVAGYVDINNRIPDATMGFPNTHFGRRDLLFINNGLDASGGVTFREVGEMVGLEKDNFEYGLGSLFTDLDNDGDLDLYVTNDTNPNRLYENKPFPGGKAADPVGIGIRFEEVGQPANVGDSNSGMGIAGGDFDGDGRFDLFVTNLGDQFHSIYRNQITGENYAFQDATNSIGISDIGVGWTGWGTSWADVDLDTDLDLMVINGRVPILDPPNDAQIPQLYANLTAEGEAAGTFADMTTAAGLTAVGPLLGRGGAMADYDNDGDMDMAAMTIGGPLVLLQNDGAEGNWLQLSLDGFAGGAVITAVLPDGQTMQRELHTGSSYLASEDPRCHLGLGNATAVAELTIHWSYGEVTRLTDIKANQILEVTR